jgi:F0F1-type ATP synthase epsilon subunit
METMKVRITRATELLWEGEALSVTSKNVDGPFDVLPMHANFVTLIRNEPITILNVNKTETKHSFKYAVMYVQDNIVKIYADFI